MIDKIDPKEIVENVADTLGVSVRKVEKEVEHLVTIEEKKDEAVKELKISEEKKQQEYAELTRKIGNIRLALDNVMNRLNQLLMEG